jgi:hypothetical protein
MTVRDGRQAVRPVPDLNVAAAADSMMDPVVSDVPVLIMEGDFDAATEPVDVSCTDSIELTLHDRLTRHHFWRTHDTSRSRSPMDCRRIGGRVDPGGGVLW